LSTKTGDFSGKGAFLANLTKDSPPQELDFLARKWYTSNSYKM
jgi:hypothetical protein